MGEYKLHIIDAVSDETLGDFFTATVGTLQRSLGSGDFRRFQRARKIIKGTPSFALGDCSWFRDQVPDEIRQIHDLLSRGSDPTMVTHELIVDIMLIMDAAPHYGFNSSHKLIGPSRIISSTNLEEFLFEHVGKRMIPITWTD